MKESIKHDDGSLKGRFLNGIRIKIRKIFNKRVMERLAYNRIIKYFEYAND